MKHQWVAYAIVIVLSMGAGVAIAGLPDNQSVDSTIIPPSTTEQASVTLVTVATDPTVATTALPAATTPTTQLDTATTTTTTTLVPATTAAPTTTVDASLPARSQVSVAVANGANIAGLASATADELEAIGYVDVVALDGTQLADFTVVYFTPGFESSAVRLAEDLGANPDLRAPLSEAPPVGGLSNVQLLAYLGADRPTP